MASEKFCLRWNDFESNISTAFRELRDDKDFFDVTLSCDDEQIQAHKVILSACSPFFRGVLRRNPHAHPLLYLKGVKFSDLTAVLNFMYHGEVNVAQEELNSFLAVAEELRVKGLTQNNQSGNNSSSSSKKEPFSAAPRPQAAAPRLPDPVPPPKKPRPAAAPTYATHDDDDIQEVMPTVKTEPLQAAAAAPEPYQQQEQGGQLQQVDDGMGYDEEGYEDYGQYGAEGGYEGTLVDADGNKGRLSKTSLIFNSAHFRYIPLCLFQVLLLFALCTSRAAASPIPETTFTAFSRFNNAANFHSQNNGFETKVFY